MGFPYISRIEIENFRNLHGLQADLAPSTVIVGENRSGKSNLLHALRLVLDPSLPDTARDLRPEDFWDGLAAPFSGASITIRVFLSGFEGDEAAQCVLADCVTSYEPMIARLTYVYRPKASRGEAAEGEAERDALTEDDYEHVVYGGDDEARARGREVRRWLALTVLPAMRDAESQISGARRPLLRPLLDRVRPDLAAETLADVGEKLKDAGDTLLAEAPLAALQKQINDRVLAIVGPHLAVSTQLGFAAEAPEQLLRSLRLFLVDGKQRPIGDASLGTANLLYLCLLLQDLDAKCARKDAAGTVLAIEEPEAHLHPHLQRLLFRYALNRKHAVLVTTHSPHIASVAPLESLAVLRVTGAKGNPEARLYSSKGVSLQPLEVADLERYLDVTRAEMVFARGILLVEGIAEEFLIPAFAAAQVERWDLASSLDELGITVCSVAGTNFSPYWRLTSDRGWNIPRVIVTDGDPDKNGILVGRRRGARLLGNADIIKSAQSKASSDVERTDNALHEAGIFVGDRTLELDLVATLAAEMKAAFREFVGVNLVRPARFNQAIDSYAAGVDDGTSLLAEIEDIGKGRFAQRLASKITVAHEPPRHIKLALARICDRVART